MKQITIVAPREEGVIARISQTLGEAKINIASLDAVDVKDLDVILLTVDDRYNDALHALCAAGFDAVTEDAVVIRLKDEPGSLAKVTQRLFDAGIHVRSIRILQRQQGEGVVALSVDRSSEALALIQDLLIAT